MKRYFILILFFLSSSYSNELLDCSDGGKCRCLSDEDSETRGSPETLFDCGNGKYLTHIWICDGQDDCGNLKDETDCENSTSCQGFLCKDNHCIPSESKCDGMPDCPDHSDEDSCPKSDSFSNVTRSLKCRPNSEDPGCYCEDGYKLSTENNEKCTDIDECSEDGFCSQTCTNLPGSYECSCLDGYELLNRTCRASGSEPLLIFSALKEIRAISLRSKQNFQVRKAMSKAITIDTDYLESKIYWIELPIGSAVYSSNMNGSGIELVLHNGLMVPEDIAVDSVARNLYITDSGLKQILVCKMDGSMCHVLHNSNLEKPRSIILDPHQGFVYWSDWGLNPSGIYRSGMDGSQRVTLVSTSIKWPNGIAIDQTTNRLYWVDAFLNKIEYISLDDGTRKVLIEGKAEHAYSLAVFEDNLYWSDWSSFSVFTCNKFTGQGRNVMTSTSGKLTLGVHVHHPVLASKTHNPCLDNPCSHMCLISPLSGYICACPPEFNLAADGWMCVVDGDIPKWFVNDVSRIYQLRPESVGNISIEELPLTQIDRIGRLVYDWKSKYLYISDMSKPAIYAVNTTTMITTELLRNDSMMPEDMAFDWLSGNLYWLDSRKGTVEVVNTETSRTATIVEGLSKPTAIALLPTIGIMFISTNGEDLSLAMYDMDGTNRKTFDAVKGHISAIAVHPTQSLLYFAEPKTMTISSIDYSNPKSLPTIVKKTTGSVTSIAVNEKYIYWTDSCNFTLKFKSHSQDFYNTISLPGSENECASLKVIYAAQPAEANLGHVSCMSSDECSYLCLSSPKGRSCVCLSGTQLSKDNHTCLDKPPRCSGNDFLCQNGRCILPGWKCDGRDDCGDGSDEVACPLLTSCNKDQFLCGDSGCIPMLWRCDGENDCNDTSDEVHCSNTSCDPESQFRCDNGQCIRKSWTCDGSNDCFDGSDERICTKKCSSIEFKCGNEVCIKKTLVCDQKNDCADGSDEKNCPETICKEFLYACKDGVTCIYDHELCDGYKDCPTGEDELNCTKLAQKCDPDEYYCSSNSRCISKLWLCDGDQDCSDGADERHESCSTGVESTFLPSVSGCEGFFCRLTVKCITWSKVCDGENNCRYMEDEGGLCSTACSGERGGCSQVCHKTPQGSKCSCLTGYSLSVDGVTCEDVNECDIPGSCSQFCNNTEGGFKCTCAEGYFMDGFEKCKSVDGPATLVYVLSGQIRGIDLGTHSQHVIFNVKDTAADIRGMDYDASDGIYFWSDWKEGTIYSYQPSTDTRNVLLTGRDRPCFIRWDWNTKNLYYTNQENEFISCSQNGKQCSTLLHTGHAVSSFDIAPIKGLMFWTVWKVGNRRGVIERAEMDGSRRMVIVSEEIKLPSAVTVDHVMEMIYWVNQMPMSYGIECSDFHGLNRRVVAEVTPLNHPLSLVLFEDYVYWSNFNADSLMRCDKHSGRNCTEILKGNTKTEVLMIANKATQPKGENRCLDNECSQLCVPKRSGHVCKCDDNYNLVNGTCEMKTKEVFCSPPCFPF